MAEFAVAIIAGLATVAIVRLFLLWWGSTRQCRDVILPGRGQRHPREQYDHLIGTWNLYYCTYDFGGSSPIWMHGTTTYEMLRDGTIRGRSELDTHPKLPMKYTLRGEIRSGWLITTDAGHGDSEEFAVVMIPNLLSRSVLVGLWLGMDNTKSAIGAPVVQSRRLMTKAEVNAAASNAGLHVVPTGSEIPFHPSVPLSSRADSSTSHPPDDSSG